MSPLSNTRHHPRAVRVGTNVKKGTFVQQPLVCITYVRLNWDIKAWLSCSTRNERRAAWLFWQFPFWLIVAKHSFEQWEWFAFSVPDCRRGLFLQAAISVSLINTSPPHPEAMFGTHRELDQNSTLGCWLKSQHSSRGGVEVVEGG